MGATVEVRQPLGRDHGAAAASSLAGQRDPLQRAPVVYAYRRPGVDGPLSMVPRAIERWRLATWTEHRGWRLAMVVEEYARTGRAVRDQALRGAVGRVESRDIDGLVVPSLAHLGASPQQALSVIEVILAAGGVFASVAEALDVSTPLGRRRYLLLCRVCSSDRTGPNLAGRES